MPANPKSGESEQEFISRCIKHEINKGTAQDEKQGYAICKSIWDKESKFQIKYKKLKLKP